jgi:hypothetical protein
MEECKHENIETNSYAEMHYFTLYITTVKTCADCGEVLEEKVVRRQ